MSSLMKWFGEYLNTALSYSVIPDSQVVVILAFVALMSLFLFVVYRVVSHRALYNKSLNISIAVLPFFISTIILCLQSSVVITLGTIGALAIVRFRTAVKDPVDMIYILWSVHIGIMAGCQLFMVSIITSVFVTILLLALENLHLGRSSYTLVVNCADQMEKELTAVIKAHARKMRIKSRNFTSGGVDYVVDLAVKNPQALTAALSECKEIRRFSLIEYDSEDIV